MTDTIFDTITYEREYLEVELGELPADDELTGPRPDKAFVKDIKKHGLRHPIDLAEEPDTGSWHVLDGTRRIKALRQLGYTTIDALWVKIGRNQWDNWSVQANRNRTDNPVRDARAIARLASDGFSLDYICAELGLTKPEVNRLGQLVKLPAPVLQGLESGKLTMSTAEALCKMPAVHWPRAESVLSEKGKLTGGDVQALRQVMTAQVMSNLHLPDMSAYMTPPGLYALVDEHGLFLTNELISGEAIARSIQANEPNSQLYRLESVR